MNGVGTGACARRRQSWWALVLVMGMASCQSGGLATCDDLAEDVAQLVVDTADAFAEAFGEEDFSADVASEGSAQREDPIAIAASLVARTEDRADLEQRGEVLEREAERLGCRGDWAQPVVEQRLDEEATERLVDANKELSEQEQLAMNVMQTIRIQMRGGPDSQ